MRISALLRCTSHRKGPNFEQQKGDSLATPWLCSRDVTDTLRQGPSVDPDQHSSGHADGAAPCPARVRARATIPINAPASPPAACTYPAPPKSTRALTAYAVP